ncbi:hypothetical protein FOA43_004155 [Brettanomyces nanus]|uniref:[acyl-carrier-protein] S-malonyltransferase n=1 Tax=Eeniella nana TaxID=13502 RepID=A0A875S548_EENNA|nr:uncharacterized protein FOA43_004155 [Brettanomyces nanus]QPG76761.1 hypothetical protein FOA43_004155 [Brettanomyces nanus]
MSTAHIVKRVLVCPGQGKTDAKGLLSISKYATKKLISKLLDRADFVLPQLKLSQYIRHPGNITDASDLQKTIVQQPLLILTSYLQNEMFKINHNGLDIVNTADFMIGHSLGEISSLVLQKVIPFEKGLEIGYKRGQLMQSIVDGNPPMGMYAVLFQPSHYDLILKMLNELDVNIANYNTYSQVTVSGEKSELARKLLMLSNMLAEHKIWKTRVRSVDLRVQIPFHHPILEPMEQDLAEIIGTGRLPALQVPVISNLDGEIVSENSEEQIRKIIHVTSRPVQLTKCLEHFVGDRQASYEFFHYGATTQGLVRRFYDDLFKLNRIDEKPHFTNKLVAE